MIASIGNSYAAVATVRSSTNRSAATAFPDITATSSATGDVATISDAAQARLADPMAKYYGEVPIEASPDKVAEWRAAAAALSKAQGLPDGQYDFTRMDSSQINVVMNDYIGKGVSMSRLNGLGEAGVIAFSNEEANASNGIQSSGPIDVTDLLHKLFQYDVGTGGAEGREAKFLKGSIDLIDEMAKVTGRSGSSADSTTAANSSVKLNNALAAFKKEASPTPV